MRQSAQAEVRKTNGDLVTTRTSMYSGFPPLVRYLLQPGERVLVAKPSVVVVQDEGQGERGPGTTKVVADAGVYFVRYSQQLGRGERWSRGQDGVMRRSSPAKGEWTGGLSSGAVAIAAAEE